MKILSKLLMLSVLFTFSISSGFASVPKVQEIIDQLINLDDSQATPSKAILVDHTQAVTLRSGEHAYLSGVSFENAGRNFWAGYILTRPTLKQSKILADFGGQSNTFKVYSALSQTQPVQLVEIESAGSGQGILSSTLDLVYFDGWNAKVIATVNSNDDPGRYSEQLGEEDCRTGEIIEGKIDVSLVRKEVIKTVQSSNACKNAKKTTKTEKIKISMP